MASDLFLKKLLSIESSMDAIGKNIRRENEVYSAELAERLKLGLSGDAAIQHYNEWMCRFGMYHLIVK